MGRNWNFKTYVFNCDIVKTFGKKLRRILDIALIIHLLDLLTIVFNAYTLQLLLNGLIICVAKYTIHISGDNKCIPQFCYSMKLINLINEVEFDIAIKRDMLSKYYKKLLNFYIYFSLPSHMVEML